MRVAITTASVVIASRRSAPRLPYGVDHAQRRPYALAGSAQRQSQIPDLDSVRCGPRRGAEAADVRPQYRYVGGRVAAHESCRRRAAVGQTDGDIVVPFHYVVRRHDNAVGGPDYACCRHSASGLHSDYGLAGAFYD